MDNYFIYFFLTIPNTEPAIVSFSSAVDRDEFYYMVATNMGNPLTFHVKDPNNVMRFSINAAHIAWMQSKDN